MPTLIDNAATPALYALLDTKSAADIIDTTTETLKRSRRTGSLWGVPAPPYRKVGRMVKYHPVDIANWINALPKCGNTGQSSFK